MNKKPSIRKIITYNNFSLSRYLSKIIILFIRAQKGVDAIEVAREEGRLFNV